MGRGSELCVDTETETGGHLYIASPILRLPGSGNSAASASGQLGYRCTPSQCIAPSPAVGMIPKEESNCGLVICCRLPQGLCGKELGSDPFLSLLGLVTHGPGGSQRTRAQPPTEHPQMFPTQ